MRRQFHNAVLVKHGIFGEHAVDAAAERGGVHMRPGFAGRPALKETAGDLVARFHPQHAGADLDHLAGAVGQRNQILAYRHAVAAAHDAVVAEVQRAGGDFDQHLPVKRFRHRPLDNRQRIDAGAAFGQLIGTHTLSSRDDAGLGDPPHAYIAGCVRRGTDIRDDCALRGRSFVAGGGSGLDVDQAVTG